jgi:hypothetical protein
MNLEPKDAPKPFSRQDENHKNSLFFTCQTGFV